MQLRTIAACLVVALPPAFAIAAPKTLPPPAILKLADAVIAGANMNDPAAFAGRFTDDASVVDENPPFVWRGSGAGVAWWRVVQTVVQKAQLTHLKATNVRVGEFKQTATDAYMVEAMTITGIAQAKPFAESGTLTYTFHATAGKWLISTMVWTTKP